MGRPSSFTQEIAEVYIYAFRDEEGNYRYIGKANDPLKRFHSHVRDVRRRKTPVANWLRSCMQRGQLPTMVIIDSCNPEAWKERERHWISLFSNQGLLNLAKGGDEPFCPKEVRAENARKVTALRVRDKVHAEFYKLKRDLGLALSKGYVSENTKAKLKSAVQKYPDLLSSLAKHL